MEVTGYVSPIELLKEMGFLAPANVRLWEKGVHACLMPHVQAGEKKLTGSLEIFGEWVREQGLVPVEATFCMSGRDQ